MKLELYYAPIACSMVPYIALTEVGAPFDVHSVNMKRGDNRTPEYLRLNPKHAVPILIIDGKPLAENVAILTWIARAFPKVGLLPSDPMEEIKAISFMAWCASGIHPRLTPQAFPERFCDVPGTEDAVKRCAQKLLFEGYAIANDMLADGREWFFGTFTAPDAYFFWCFRRGTQFNLDLSKYPHCLAHFERMKTRPSVQKVLAFEASVMEQFAKAS